VITIHTKTITETTAGFCDIIDITAKFNHHVRAARILSGTATLFVKGSTAALTTIEHESGLVKDLREFLEKHIPSDRRYHHYDRWDDDNGFSHLRATLFGPSLAIPIVDGAPCLGAWQQIILMDFDNRPRSREIIVQLIGECE
jgi:secondary thiamine-phosphate synthase enzyme